jgi:hypothetical protein
MNKLKLNSYTETILKFYIVILISIVGSYLLPVIINQIIHLGILVYAFRRKDKSLLFAILLFFIDAPGNFFQATGLTYYGISKNLRLTIIEVIIIGLLITSLRNSAYNLISKKYSIVVYVVLSFIIILFFNSIIIGLPNGKTVVIFRTLFPFTLLFVIPLLFRDSKSLVNFTHIVLTFPFFALLDQIVQLYSGNHLVNFFGVTDVNIFMDQGINEAKRLVSAPWSTLIAIFLALYYYRFDLNNSFNKKYLLLVILISAISIFLTATRGWIVSLIFISILYSLTIIKLNYKLLRLLILIPLVVLLLVSISSVLRDQLNNVVARLNTLVYIFDGDVTAGGTLFRLDLRAPVVMEKFYLNPLFGNGFSEIGFEYFDQHVGNQNILMTSGIVGFILIILFFIFFLGAMIRRINTSRSEYYRKEALFLIIFLMGLVLIHSSSTQLFGFYLKTDSFEKWILVSFFIAFSFSRLKKNRII